MAKGSKREANGTPAALFRVGMIGALIAVLLPLTPAGESVEWQGRDLLLRIRGARSTQAKIAIVGIADSTLQTWTEPMLFWGPRYAAVIERARNAGAKWIGLDVIPNVSADEWLIQRFPEQEGLLSSLPDRQLGLALRGGRVALSFAADRQPIEQLTSIPAVAGNLGFTDATFPEEGIIRRIQLYRGEGEEREISLPALLAQRAKGIGPDESTPTTAPDELWINYLGPPATVKTIPAERVAEGSLRAEEREALRDAVVLIGPTYGGSNDFHRGPSGKWYPGVEILAHTVATLVDARPLRVPSPLWAALGTLALGLVAAAVGGRLETRAKAVVFAALAFGWCAAAFAAVKSDLMLPLLGPFLSLMLTALAQKFWLAREESRERRRVESLFGEHVSETVAKRLLEGPPVPADGERRPITVLFADIRGFTSLSEKAPPEQVVRLLNQTLTALSDCVLASEGTLDKYVGDCVMAFWNAPSDQPDHAARAIRTALSMQEAVERLNGHLESQGLPAISVRVGINTGDAVVGSIGSPALRDYTVIGNTVNLASRLESANKELGTSILMGEATYLAAGTLAASAREHSLAIRGVEAAVTAYALSGKSEAQEGLAGARGGNAERVS